MQPFVRPVFVLHSSASLEELMRRVIKQPMGLHRVADAKELRALLRRASPASVCVIDPFGAAGRDGGPSEELRDLMLYFPLLTVVAAFELQPVDAPLLQTLFAWGVADVLDIGREQTPAAVKRRLGEVRGRWAMRLLTRALPKALPSRARAMLAVVSEVAADGGQIPDLAKALRISERTVPRWCERAGLPPARRLLVWFRLLMMAELLDDPARSVASIARACGYASGASLNFTVRTFLGMTPGILRAQGAFRIVAERFRAELLAHRSETRGLRRRESEWLN